MPKYDENVIKQCVAAVRGINSGNFVKHEKVGELKNLADIRKAYGPNPKATQRYCKKAQVPLPKRKTVEPKAKAAPAAKK